MLSGGVLPLDLLDSRTNSWIQEQKRGRKTTAANQPSSLSGWGLN
jgi:hypothetical protein